MVIAGTENNLKCFGARNELYFALLIFSRNQFCFVSLPGDDSENRLSILRQNTIGL